MNPARALLLVAGAALLPAVPASAACDVTVQFAGFDPSPHTVAPGTTVTWCWNEGNHTVTGTGFDSGVRQQNAAFTHTFTSIGSHPYACTIHPSMQGQVVVQQATPSPTKTPSKTPSKTSSPGPATTSAAPRTTAPATTAPAPAATTAAPTRTPSPTPTPTTASPTAAPATAAVSPTQSPTPLVIDPAPAKPKTGLAIGLGVLVAAAALGGAGLLFMRGRSAG